AYMGTVVTYGRGKGVVVATGFDTVFGKLAYELQKEDREPTPLQKRLEHFGRVITAIVSILVVLVFIEELFEGLNVYEGFLTAISLAVSAVPEGLPAVLTITLALGVQRMARRNAIVRRLASVETLGNATVICTDKTGTLTRNEMTVKKIYVNGKFIRVTGSGYEPEGEFIDDNGVKIKPLGDSTLKKLLLIGLLCNDSKLVRKSTTWTITGDPTEGALVVTAVKAGLNQEETRETFPRINEIPFDSRRKRMSTLHVIEGKPVLYSKGAPEVLLNLCSHIEENGIVRPITDTDKKKILEAAKKMASEALRVLALAYRDFERTPTELKEEDERYLVFVGLVGMIDPPRPEVKAALKKAREAGIKVIMVTGDHKDTAVAIAKEIGLIDDSENVTVLTGSDLDKMDEEEFAEIVDKVHIFARVSPEHKLKIVKYLKRKGHIVAMTGDGVNDAPAVKHADIGIAMGIRGTDVTRDAADLILADDNFATIVAAIEEGRTIYENVRKFIRLLLSANWDEIAVVFVSALLDMPIPFTPAQILWINLLTDGFPALALGLDPPEPDIMKRPPRSPKEKIYEKMELFFLVSVILSLFAWVAPFWIALQLKDTLPEARTLAFTQAVIFELLLALNCRSEKHFVFGNLKILLANKSLLLAVLASLVLQLLVIYLPPLQYMFNTSPLTYLDWALVTVFACIAILLSPKFWDKPLLRSPREK
ncbi:MAG: cation-translocating P-type ATPase, partial [Thermoproteales archaeon]|nr:cation-translocating P-type ATPase [Thermoproteales archaeon]